MLTKPFSTDALGALVTGVAPWRADGDRPDSEEGGGRRARRRAGRHAAGDRKPRRLTWRGLLFVLLVAAQIGAGAFHVPALNYVFGAAFYAGLLFLSQYAIYATMRYRASRARFREIGFRLGGSPWRFAQAVRSGIAFGYWLWHNGK